MKSNESNADILQKGSDWRARERPLIIQVLPEGQTAFAAANQQNVKPERFMNGTEGLLKKVFSYSDQGQQHKQQKHQHCTRDYPV